MTILTYQFFLRVAGNLVYFEGRPGLLPRYSPGMGGAYTPTQTRVLGLRQAFPPFVGEDCTTSQKKTSTWEVRGCEAFH